MALSTEQMLQLNAMMYMGSSPLPSVTEFEGQRVEDWINSIDTSRIDPNTDYGIFTTGEEWLDIIESVKNDPALMQLEIADTHIDNAANGGHGVSAVFISEDTGEAVVTFKGTESAAEWSDNFAGGNAIDTPHQQNALQWYQETYRELGLDNYEVTVTGHSKGGNKAKYIAILDNTVDHCVAFDGQGFSDNFMEHYADRIAQRQDIIHNHNIAYDYVNFLLNDVGTTTFYDGQNIQNFLENHCPNSFMKFGDDGSFQMVVNPYGRPDEIQALDNYLNSYLRSMPDNKRADALALVNIIWNTMGNMDSNASFQDILNTLLPLAADPEYSDDLSYFLAYLIEYEQAHPEFSGQLNSLLETFGMGAYTNIIDIVHEVLNLKYDIGFATITFDDVVGSLDFLSGIIPDWLLNWIRKKLREEYGIELSLEEAKNLLNIIAITNDNMHSIQIQDNGSDIKIPSGRYNPCCFSADTQALRNIAVSLRQTGHSLGQVGESVTIDLDKLQVSFTGMVTLRATLWAVNRLARELGTDLDHLASAANEIAALLEKAEQQVVSNATI